MRILEIELIDYERMPIMPGRRFLFTPKEVMTLILGKNGAGKSSMLEEMFPFPGDANLFGKNGSKRVKYEHLGVQYEVTSTFSPNRHHFRRFVNGDWEEMNEGGTARVQLDLAKSVFGVTPEIRDVLLNKLRFSSMGPQQRRHFFTMMSDADYTYGLKIFNAVKDHARDLTGAIKFNRNRISVETAKLIDEKERKELESEVELLYKELEVLFQERGAKQRPHSEIRGELEEDLYHLNELATRCILNLPTRPEASSAVDLISLQEEIQSLDKRVYGLQEQLSIQVKRHDELTKELTLLSQTEAQNEGELKAKLEELSLSIQALEAKLGHTWNFTDIAQVHAAFSNIENELDRIFTELPDNSERYYSSETLKNLKEERQAKVNQKEVTRTQLQTLDARIAHQESHKDKRPTECPMCKHSWVLGYDEKHYQELIETRATLRKTDRELDESIKVLDEKIAEVLEFFEHYRQYTRIKAGANLLLPLWEQLDKDNLAFTYPRSAISWVNRLRSDLPILLQIEQVFSERKKLEVLLEAVKASGNKSIDETKLRCANIEKAVEELNNEIRTKQHTLNILKTYHQNAKEYLEIVEGKLTHLIRRVEALNEESVRALRDELLHKAIKTLQSRLAVAEEKLNFAQLQYGIVEELKANTHEAQLNEEAAKALMKTLSPNEGLIAEGLMGFINAFTGQMNNVIEAVWTYPFRILPCAPSDEKGIGLDYRFPMIVATKDKPIPDINVGSKGMKEITDLAFKIGFMKYLGLTEVPLYLDEFGDGLDQFHRESSTRIIQQIIEQMQFKQVFVISHHVENYGGIANCDICSLTPTEISLPGVNANVTFS